MSTRKRSQGINITPDRHFKLQFRLVPQLIHEHIVMGRLWLAICAVLLCSSVALAGYATSKKDLERAAELAVERAAERAAERAVEKSLNSGNSSTITVTVKEAYENAKKIAEEAAAPGSESTRPYNPKIFDRQYAYQPPAAEEYRVNESAEAEELGISKEALNSSVEDVGSAELGEKFADGDSDLDMPLDFASFESIRAGGDRTSESSAAADFDLSLGFGLDFGSLDMSDNFGPKASGSTKTETYTTSYSKPKGAESPVDVNDEDDAEVFRNYASDFGGSGWSRIKQRGWVRHRPLWDDSKSLVSRGSLRDDLKRSYRGNARNTEKKSTEIPRRKLFKRNAGDYGAAENTNQVAVPLASLSLDPKAPALLYQLLQKEFKYSTNNYSVKSPVPMKLYVTVPVPYLRAVNQQDDKEFTHITPRPHYTTTTPRRSSDEINDEEKVAMKKAKRSNEFGMRSYGSVVNTSNEFQNKHQPQRDQYRRSIVKVAKHKLQLKSSTTNPTLEIARIKKTS